MSNLTTPFIVDLLIADLLSGFNNLFEFTLGITSMNIKFPFILFTSLYSIYCSS
ncbi:hypothetical protein UUU_24790 (plasmid) [Klebsiella pneumoniae subsp. pneumoniae DSM 30104 = JCM 1662 = NBRC 14940]|nr:hypothetical protein UUU_24790 [Klebsiella pneumoniae subsp. pneumoniae DSM 30104 = JCM 1662 = NBRC 14940]